MLGASQGHGQRWQNPLLLAVTAMKDLSSLVLKNRVVLQGFEFGKMVWAAA